jgi:hypothetical protein
MRLAGEILMQISRVIKVKLFLLCNMLRWELGRSLIAEIRLFLCDMLRWEGGRSLLAGVSVLQGSRRELEEDSGVSRQSQSHHEQRGCLRSIG